MGFALNAYTFTAPAGTVTVFAQLIGPKGVEILESRIEGTIATAARKTLQEINGSALNGTAHSALVYVSGTVQLALNAQHDGVETALPAGIEGQELGEGWYVIGELAGGQLAIPSAGSSVFITEGISWPTLALIREGGSDAVIHIEAFDDNRENIAVNDTPTMGQDLTIGATAKSITSFNAANISGQVIDGMPNGAVGGAYYHVSGGAVRYNFGGTSDGSGSNGLKTGGAPTPSSNGRSVTGMRVTWGKTPYDNE
jgi:hypothetical protein